MECCWSLTYLVEAGGNKSHKTLFQCEVLPRLVLLLELAALI